MNNKLNQSLMVAAVALGGVLAANSSAVADSVTSPAIEFYGTVTNMCAVSESFGGNPSAGVGINLICNGDTQVAITNFQDVTKPTAIAFNKADKSNAKTIDRSNRISHTIMLLTGPVNQNIIVDINGLNSTAVKPDRDRQSTKITVTAQ